MGGGGRAQSPPSNWKNRNITYIDLSYDALFFKKKYHLACGCVALDVATSVPGPGAAVAEGVAGRAACRGRGGGPAAVAAVKVAGAGVALGVADSVPGPVGAVVEGPSPEASLPGRAGPDRGRGAPGGGPHVAVAAVVPAPPGVALAVTPPVAGAGGAVVEGAPAQAALARGGSGGSGIYCQFSFTYAFASCLFIFPVSPLTSRHNLRRHIRIPWCCTHGRIFRFQPWRDSSRRVSRAGSSGEEEGESGSREGEGAADSRRRRIRRPWKHFGWIKVCSKL